MPVFAKHPPANAKQACYLHAIPFGGFLNQDFFNCVELTVEFISDLKGDQ